MGDLAIVELLKDDLKDQPGNPLRPNQIQGYRDELQQLGVTAEGRDLDGVPRDFLKGAKGTALRRIRQIHTILETQAPKKVTGDRANRIHARIKETLETVIRPGMLPRSAMRRNVPGAVGHLLRTEFNGVFKDAVLTVKRGMRALDPENADPDFTNMERFRPEGLNPDGTSTFRADAQIVGVFGMTPAAKENWPLADPPTSALAQVHAREEREAKPKLAKAKKATAPHRELTEDQKQVLLDRLQKANEARQAKKDSQTTA